jgi:aryl-phospho-beta-D-glucosidase BglC (GH1 family)
MISSLSNSTANYILLYSLLFLGGCINNKNNSSIQKPVNKTELSQETRYKGFNLLGKFDADWSNTGYLEWDFKTIHELGFNFVRLPIDYRTYTEKGDWSQYRESSLKEIDTSIAWAQKYAIHVNLNLHRAPGFCVNKSTVLPANQNLNLWTDKIAQDAFCSHWAMFAKRYQTISEKYLSFNLVNEPYDVSPEVYARIMKRAIDTIRFYSPNRPIHVDGLGFGNEANKELVSANIIHSFHNYNPFQLTHYKASWVGGSETWNVPRWPTYDISNFLYGTYKPSLNIPFVIKGNFKKDSEVTINIQQVSSKADFVIKLNGKTIFRHAFLPADGAGEWTKVIKTQWGFQNIYNKDYKVILPEEGNELAFGMEEGDWLTFNSITIKSSTDTISILPTGSDYGSITTTVSIDPKGKLVFPDGRNPLTGSSFINKWASFRDSNKVSVFIGECGVFNRTPHPIVLAYQEDMLKMYKVNNIGFALWEFRGSFGIFDSERTDVQYEDYQGHKLDRKYLDLLQKY